MSSPDGEASGDGTSSGAVTAPLEDPAYEPAHRPINGLPPEVIAKWGAASQLRWFKRFWRSGELRTMTTDELKPFFCHSASHLGACCSSCEAEQDDGYFYADGCCCRAGRSAPAA